MGRNRSLAAVRTDHGSGIADTEFRACSFGKVPGRVDSRRPSVYTLYVLVDHVARVMVHQIRWLAMTAKSASPLSSRSAMVPEVIEVALKCH